MPGDHLENTRDHERLWFELENLRKQNLVWCEIQIGSDTDAVVEGDGQGRIVVSENINGWRLLSVRAYVGTPSDNGSIVVDIRNETTGYDFLSYSAVIPEDELDSFLVDPQFDIDSDVERVWTGQRLVVDVSSAGENAMGLGVILTFGK
jgi:hypothetical protein